MNRRRTPSRAENCVRRIAAVLALGALAPLASAACNNPQNWLESPTRGVKYFVGHEPAQDGFGSSTYIDEPERMAYPPLLPREMWEKSGSGDFNLPVAGPSGPERNPNLGVPVAFYEPDGKGQWRLCRLEQWTGRSRENERAQRRAAAATYLANQRPGNPLVAQWGATNVGYQAEIFMFDAKGRLEKKLSAFARAEGPYVSHPECFRYDERDSVLLYVNAKVSAACPGGEPDVRDDWMKVQTAWVGGRRMLTRLDKNSGEGEKGWSRVTQFRSVDGRGPGGNAHSSSALGVERITGAAEIGPKDDNAVNVAPHVDGKAVKSIGYYFTRPPVPPGLLDKLDTIYNHDRRRELDLGSSFRRVEWFAAGTNVAVNSYILGAGSVLRHEQRAPDGRLKRAINVAFEGFSGTPHALYEEPDIKKPLKLKGHEYLYRVWDYDESGRATLVAIGWNSSFKKQPMDLAKVSFGTPDGEVRWKTKEEFFKAFGFDAKAEGAHLDKN